MDHKQPIILLDAQTSSAYPEYRLDALARGYRTVVLFPLNVSDAEDVARLRCACSPVRGH